MVTIAMPGMQRDLGCYGIEAGPAVTVLELEESRAKPGARVRRAGESGHLQNADRLGGGPFLDHLQRAAEAPERGHEPVVTETLVV